MAVPLRTPDNAVVAAVVLTSVIQDFTEVNIRRWLPLLRSAARHLSHILAVSRQERVGDGLA
jgi:DNA-binding IclR family transcriptional regulator